jgi:hypothetical protein
MNEPSIGLNGSFGRSDDNEAHGWADVLSACPASAIDLKAAYFSEHSVGERQLFCLAVRFLVRFCGHSVSVFVLRPRFRRNGAGRLSLPAAIALVLVLGLALSHHLRK